MAVDTRNKRMAMISMARPLRPTLPVPTGGIDTADERAQVVYRYSGSLSVAGAGGAAMMMGLAYHLAALRRRRWPQ